MSRRRRSSARKCGNVKDPSAYPDRCGYGPRQPLLVISPYARQNFVDNTLTDETSILRFIEDNWQLGRLGDQSMDAKAGSLGNMFDFDPNAKRAAKVFLDPDTGLVTKTAPVTAVSPDTTPLAPGSGSTAPAGGGMPHGGHPAGTKGSSKSLRIRMRCTARSGSRSVKASCRASGVGASRTTAVRFRLLRGNALLATAATPLRHSRASAVLRAKRALGKGTYVLRVTTAQRRGLSATNHSVRLG